ncbi:MAG: GspE/PulE family protein [Candidatus Gracilibacteria bacterium]|nr:GspE/PulE family protein [Candidatus Gracilibacteria bacterium]
MEKIELKRNIGDVVDYVNNVFKMALDRNASDIHIEPTEKFLLIRYRQDGDFFMIDKLDKENVSPIITRLKVLSKVKIDENKKPQDGKIVYFYDRDQKNIDIRVSTLPTSYGEKMVLRLLRPDESLTSLDKLGFIDLNMGKIKKALSSSYGIILIAGPTGSGKSTTLFGILKNFNPLDFNISTLEDPIEYNIDFVNQSQVKPEIGFTFATGLRSLVRQDPDIIMVGEIRDKETATLAVEAALTGHLVLSTIHTNTATATVQRLINMGVEPFLLSSAMRMVISQRLIKRVCQNCKKPKDVAPHVLKTVREYLYPIMDKQEVDNLIFYEGAGCDVCNGSGYKGRMGVHEVLIVEPYLEEMILNRSTANEMTDIARKHGMLTIIQDALIKSAMGQTTIEESLQLI